MHCTLCNSNRITTLYYRADGYNICRCTNCSFVFTLPIPDRETIEDFYRQQSVFFIGQGEDTFQEYKQNPQKYRENYFSRLKKIIQFVRTGKFLDIGCAGGILLDCARLKGFEVEGIEPSDAGAKMCNELGIKVHHGYFLETLLPINHFDAVTMYDVLEHTQEPAAEIKKAYEILKPNGVIHITLPNIESALAKLHKENWDMITPPEHLNYFSPQTLSVLLKQNGFEVREIRTFNGEPRYTLMMLIKGIWNTLRRGKVPVNQYHPSQKIETNNGNKPPNHKRGFLRNAIWNLLLIGKPFLIVLPLFDLGEGIEIIAQKTRNIQ